MKKISFFVFIVIVLFYGCVKEKNKISSDYFLSQDVYSFDGTDSLIEEKLPISVTKLKQLLGDKIEPIAFKQVNIDNEVDNELIVCYREKKDENIKLVVLDILPNEIIKKIFDFQTAINKKEDFSLQVNNLLYEDDNCFILEGVADDGRRLLYIIRNDQGKEFSIIGSFSATYSIFFDFTEKDDESTKYYLLKDVVLIDNALSATNTNIQRRDIYVWDYGSGKFTLTESSQIVSKEVTDVPMDILYSGENYFNYIKGFWYPEQYKKLIENDKLNPDEYPKESIQYVYFNEENGEKEIDINYGDYEDKYTIDKIVKLGGQKPGLRFSLRDNAYSTIIYYKYIDLYLYESKVLKFKGPENFDFITYVRLPKPFVEYLEEKKADLDQENANQLTLRLLGTLVGNGFTIDFDKDHNFTVTANKKKETGKYKISKQEGNDALFLLFTDENTIIKEKYFIINFTDTNNVILLPMKIDMDGIIVKNVKPLSLKRVE